MIFATALVLLSASANAAEPWPIPAGTCAVSKLSAPTGTVFVNCQAVRVDTAMRVLSKHSRWKFHIATSAACNGYTFSVLWYSYQSLDQLFNQIAMQFEPGGIFFVGTDEEGYRVGCQDPQTDEPK